MSFEHAILFGTWSEKSVRIHLFISILDMFKIYERCKNIFRLAEMNSMCFTVMTNIECIMQ